MRRELISAARARDDCSYGLGNFGEVKAERLADRGAKIGRREGAHLVTW